MNEQAADERSAAQVAALCAFDFCGHAETEHAVNGPYQWCRTCQAQGGVAQQPDHSFVGQVAPSQTVEDARIEEIRTHMNDAIAYSERMDLPFPVVAGEVRYLFRVLDRIRGDAPAPDAFSRLRAALNHRDITQGES